MPTYTGAVVARGRVNNLLKRHSFSSLSLGIFIAVLLLIKQKNGTKTKYPVVQYEPDGDWYAGANTEVSGQYEQNEQAMK